MNNMKRRVLFSVLSVLLIGALVFCMPSCKKDSNDGLTADAVWKDIDSAMDKLTSYEQSLKIDMTYSEGGIEIKGSADGKTICAGIGSEEFYYSSEVTMEMKAEAISYSTKMYSRDLYVGGRFFIESEDDYHDQKIFCKMTPKEAEEYLSEENSIKYENATNKELKKNEDGSFTLTFSGYTADDLYLVQKEFGMQDAFKDVKLLDVKVTVEAGADYLAKVLKAEFVLEESSDGNAAPSVIATMTYSNFNTATKGNEAPDIRSYEEIDDLLFLKKLDSLFEVIEESKRGKFILSIGQTVTIGDNKTRTTEEDTVNYGENEKGYYYNIDAVVNEGTASEREYTIGYTDGKKIIGMNGASDQVTDQTADEAREYINSLIRNPDYKLMYVTDVEKVSDDTYKITSRRADTADAEPFFKQLGATLNYVSSTITITLKDGNIDNIVTSRTAKGGINVQGTVTFVTLSIRAEIDYKGITFMD